MTSSSEIDAKVLRFVDELVVDAELRVTEHILFVERLRLRGIELQRSDEFATHLRRAAQRAAQQRASVLRVFNRHMR